MIWNKGLPSNLESKKEHISARCVINSWNPWHINCVFMWLPCGSLLNTWGLATCLPYLSYCLYASLVWLVLIAFTTSWTLPFVIQCVFASWTKCSQDRIQHWTWMNSTASVSNGKSINLFSITVVQLSGCIPDTLQTHLNSILANFLQNPQIYNILILPHLW